MRRRKAPPVKAPLPPDEKKRLKSLRRHKKPDTDPEPHQGDFPRFNPNPVLELSATGEISYFNDAAGAMARELGRKTPAQMLPPDTAAMVRECLAANTPKLRVETHIGPRVMSWSFFPVKSNNTVYCYGGDITERKLTEQSLRLQSAAMEAAANAMVITDQSGNIQSVNPAFTTLTGYTAQEVLGKNPRLLQSGNHNESFYRNLWQTISSGQVWRGELTNRRKDGSLYFEEMTITPLRNANGVIARYIAIKQDVSGRKRTEEALRQSEEQLRAMFDVASVGIVQADPRTGRWLRVNKKFCDITGYSADELLRMCVADITHSEDLRSDREAFERVVRGEAPDYRMEKRYIRKDGTLAWVNVNMTVLRDAAGQPTRTLAVIEDITERKRTEEALRASQQLTEGIINAMPVRIFWKDKNLVYLGCNAAFARDAGFADPKDIIGKDDHQMGWREQAELYRKDDHQVIESGCSKLLIEEPQTTPEGNTITLLSSKIPLRDSKGGVSGVVGTYVDITERKRLEVQLFQAQKMETVGKLAGGIAHEFNSILTAIIGHSELLLGDLPAGSSLAKSADEISQAAGRAAVLTRQLLAYGRKQFLQPETLDLNSVIAGMAGMFRHVMGSSVDTQILPAPGLHAVKADAGQIEQVIMNMAMNARDAMPNGGKFTLETANVSIDQETVGRYPELKPGEYVMLAITDTGAGMSQKVKERVFEPFFSTKDVGQGTGLGLSTCYGIVKQSGGHINVYSELGRGTSFKIYLPQVDQPAPVPVSPLNASELPRGTESILLVEDDPALREMAAMLLRRLGYTVLAAADGIEALRLIQQRDTEPVDLLFTDVVMPHMNGKELANRVLASHPRTRILFSSAYTENAIVHQGVLDKGVALLQKPFTPSALARKLRAVLDQPNATKPEAAQQTFGFTKTTQG